MLPLDFINPLLNQSSYISQFVFLMLTVLFQFLSMLLPSRLLTLPKVSENMELSINSPKTIKLETDTCTSSVPTAMAREEDEAASGQETFSSTASSPSEGLDTAVVETLTPRSMTPDSSIANEDISSRKKIRKDLSTLWTEHSEKVRVDTSFTKPPR